MSILIEFLLALVILSALIIFVSAFQTVLDYLEERADYKSRIQELQGMLEEQGRRKNAEFYLEVAKDATDPTERAYWEARAINAKNKK